jgi:type VI protein secretion system component VasK
MGASVLAALGTAWALTAPARAPEWLLVRVLIAAVVVLLLVALAVLPVLAGRRQQARRRHDQAGDEQPRRPGNPYSDERWSGSAPPASGDWGPGP